MAYLIDVSNMVLAALFFAFLCGNRAHALLLFLVYYSALKWAAYENTGISYTFTAHFELFAFVFYLGLIFFSPKIFLAFKTEIVTRFNGLSLLFDDSRGIFISKLWTSTVVATSTMGYMRYHGFTYPSENFYVSWAVNVVFFSVIGLAAALLSLRLPHKEEFSSRLGILFAGAENVDNEFRQSALSHISSEVKKLGLAVSKINRRIVIEAYDPDYDAYRATVTITTTMVSLFGDVDAQDQVQFTVTPDKFEGCKRTPNPVGQIISLFVNGEEKIRGNPQPILLGQGNGYPEVFTVGKDEQVFTFKYWCWFQTGEDFTYHSKRFCREFNVRVINRMLDEKESKFSVRRPRLGKIGEFDSKTLIYGEEWDIVNFKDLEPNVMTTLFTIERPSAALAAETSLDGATSATSTGENA